MRGTRTSHFRSSRICTRSNNGRLGFGARLEKVSPDIDFYAGDGGEQGQPEKDLICTHLFGIDGSFEISLNWKNSQNCKYNFKNLPLGHLINVPNCPISDIIDCLSQRVSISVFPHSFFASIQLLLDLRRISSDTLFFFCTTRMKWINSQLKCLSCLTF